MSLASWLLLSLAWGQESGQVLGQLEGIETQIAVIEAQNLKLEATIASSMQDAAAKDAEAARLEGSLGSRAEGGRALLRAMYRLRRFGTLRLLFGSADPVELRRRASYLRYALVADEARTAELAQLAKQKRAAADAARAAAELNKGLKAQMAEQVAALEARRGELRALVRSVRSKPALVQQLESQTAAAQREFDESARTKEGSVPEAAVASETGSFRSLRGSLPQPVSGRLLRGFGAYVDPATGNRQSHNGIRWAADPGSRFRAVADGIVTRAGYVRGYGQMVMVQHGSYATLYANANGLMVTVDARVKAGQQLGTVGTSGLGDDAETQLYFELRYNGTPQDPTAWLAR